MTKNDPPKISAHDRVAWDAQAFIALCQVRPVKDVMPTWELDLSGRCGSTEMIAMYALYQSRVAESKQWAAAFGLELMRRHGLEDEPETEKYREQHKAASLARESWIHALAEVDRKHGTDCMGAARVFAPGYIDAMPPASRFILDSAALSWEAVELVALHAALVGKPYISKNSLWDIPNQGQEG